MFFNIVNINFYIIASIAFLFSGYYRQKKAKKIFVIISFALLSFVMIFRYTPYYADYQNYIVEYEKAATMSLIEIKMSKAPLINLCCSVLNRITNNPQIFFWFTGLFILWSFFRWIYKYSSNIYISVVAFVGLLYYSVSMNIVRQYFAIAILLFAYDILESEKNSLSKYLKYIILVILAFLCHNSAIVAIIGIALPVIPLYEQYIKRIVIYGIIFFVVGQGLGWGLETFFETYDSFDSYGTNTASFLSLLVPLLILVFTMLCQHNLKTKKVARMWLNGSIVASIFSIYSVTDMLIIARIASYFSVFYILLIPEIVNVILKRCNFRTKTFLCISVIFIYYLAMIYFGRVNYVTDFNFGILGDNLL